MAVEKKGWDKATYTREYVADFLPLILLSSISAFFSTESFPRKGSLVRMGLDEIKDSCMNN